MELLTMVLLCIITSSTIASNRDRKETTKILKDIQKDLKTVISIDDECDPTN